MALPLPTRVSIYTLTHAHTPHLCVYIIFIAIPTGPHLRRQRFYNPEGDVLLPLLSYLARPVKTTQSSTHASAPMRHRVVIARGLQGRDVLSTSEIVQRLFAIATRQKLRVVVYSFKINLLIIFMVIVFLFTE